MRTLSRTFPYDAVYYSIMTDFIYLVSFQYDDKLLFTEQKNSNAPFKTTRVSGKLTISICQFYHFTFTSS